ncbi:MAG: hypothetical protein V4543_07785 [Bacteroidota bacterium]
MDHIKPSQQLVLEALTKCKFLTTGHMMDLGIKSDRANLNRELKAMRLWPKPPIAHINFGSHPSEGKLESVHYLTEYGERLLIEGIELEKKDIKRPVGKSSLFFKDYNHRRNTIDIHIALLKEQQAGTGEIVFFDTYFDQEGNNRRDASARSKTKIDLEDGSHLIADAVTLWRGESGSKLFAIEMYNGKDTSRVEKQLYQHLVALSEGILAENVSRDHKHNTGYRVLCVFEFIPQLQVAWQRLLANPDYEDAKGYFLAKPLEFLKKQPFPEGWLDLDGNEVSLW